MDICFLSSCVGFMELREAALTPFHSLKIPPKSFVVILVLGLCPLYMKIFRNENSWVWWPIPVAPGDRKIQGYL